MTYGMVILLTQLLAASIGGIFMWGFWESRGIAACMGDGLALCMMETALLTYFIIGAVIAAAFALFLFKAYRTQ